MTADLIEELRGCAARNGMHICDQAATALEAKELENAEMRLQVIHENSRHIEAAQERDSLAEQVKVLHKYLKSYGQHRWNCVWRMAGSSECDCGLVEALATGGK